MPPRVVTCDDEVANVYVNASLTAVGDAWAEYWAVDPAGLRWSCDRLELTTGGSNCAVLAGWAPTERTMWCETTGW